VGYNNIADREGLATNKRPSIGGKPLQQAHVMNFSIKSYNSRNIRINPETRYVCLTDMASAAGKKSANWTQLKGTNELLMALADIVGISAETLLYVGEGDIGTWAHPKLAIQFAQWCSPLFALQVSDWIDELLTTGKVELATQPALPPHQLAVEVADAIVNIDQKLALTQPRLAQLLRDHAMNSVLEVQVSSSDVPRLRGAVEIAQEMGFKTDHSSRVKLGNWMVKSGHQSQKKSRLCNGTYQNINCYEDTAAVREAVAAFFN
jgi:KilA-N domain